jgi:hypothetical protein
MAIYPLTNDPIVYRAIGILIAVLIGLALIPLDWRVRLEDRAARLEVRRLEAATRSTADVLADRDQLRAEFAIATRRFESTIAQLKTENARELAALDKKLAGRPIP